MSKDFGRPSLAAENRDLVEQRLKEVSEGAGPRETQTVDWRGTPTYFDVIKMPVESLYYNPGTHRIRAQRSHDPARDRQLDAEPWGLEGQAYLHHLLKNLPADPSKPDPEFGALMDSLREFKQTDPGLITRDGVLVNGNTRRAALKELGESTMRVAVLPESCTWEDINRVELSLQLRKEHRRDYSYINRLLAIEEQFAAGRLVPDIAREFRIKKATCEQDLWILSCLQDLLERSREGEAQLRLMDFEQHQEKLRELHRRYTNESAVSKEKAELMKENRLAVIVLGFSKTDVRLVEQDFRDRYLDHRLPDELKVQSAAASSVTIPGLGRSVKAADPRVASAKALTDVVLKAKAVEAAVEVVSTDRYVEAKRTFKTVWQAVEDALVPAGKDARVRKRKQAAPDRISDACQDIEQCVTDLVMARASSSLDVEAYDEAILRLRDSLSKLAVESKQSIPAPGDGVTWLLDAVRQGD
ncbi:transcriptional regulator [Streptomyces sp. NPDC002537]